MKKFKKSHILILSIVILFLSIYLYWEKLLNNFIYIPKDPIKIIDTSFFTSAMKKDILTKINNIDSKNSDYIEISTNDIWYYDSNYNLSTKDIIKEDIKILFQKYNIGSVVINYKNKKLDLISISFIDKDYIYCYSTSKHNYKEWYIIPVLVWRVEKVIDENWYILRECDRNICQEPQL